MSAQNATQFRDTRKWVVLHIQETTLCLQKYFRLAGSSYPLDFCTSFFGKYDPKKPKKLTKLKEIMLKNRAGNEAPAQKVGHVFYTVVRIKICREQYFVVAIGIRHFGPVFPAGLECEARP